jgi:hypothetical protein
MTTVRSAIAVAAISIKTEKNKYQSQIHRGMAYRCIQKREVRRGADVQAARG